MMDPKILYEDEYVLVLDKPSGLLVHSDGRNKEKTLVDWVLERYPDLEDVGEEEVLQSGEKIKRPGIVHRLDKETSGVILIAKTKESHQFFKKQFQNREVEKVYNAVVHGKFNPEKLEGVINFDIGRSKNDFRKWIAKAGNNSVQGITREAVTEYKVLGQKEIEGKYFAYLELKPKTGRTHQIRVHMKAIGHPVVGDRLYGPKMKNEARVTSNELRKKDNINKEKFLGFDRLALHSLSIKIKLPNGVGIKVESPLPDEFERAKKLLKKV